MKITTKNMAFWDFFNNRKETRSATNVTITTSEHDEAAIGLVFGQNAVKDSFMSLASVYRAVDIISSSVASLPLVLYRQNSDGSKVEWRTHPVYNLLMKQPSRFMTSHDFIQKGMQDILLHGNFYAIIHRDDNTKICELEYVDARKVTISKYFDNDGRLVRILYNILGRKRMYEDWEILHVKSNNLDEYGVEGISVLDFAKRTLKVCEYNEKAVENSYLNGGRLSGIISVSGPITDKQKNDMRDAWGRSIGGQNSGGVAVLSGVQKYQSVAQNNKELELLESRLFNVSEVARFFGLSPILLYDLTKQSYSSAEQAHLALLTDCLSNWIYKFESECECKLLSEKEWQRGEIKFDVKEFLRASAKDQLELHRGYFNLGVMSPNEIREALDMERVEGADERYVQSQVVTLENSKHLGERTEEANQTLDNNLKPDETTKEEEDVEENVEATPSTDEN